MLQSIRDRAQGLVAGVIILFLCLTFVLWGIEEYLNAARRIVVAEVNGQELDLQAYQATFQRLRQRAQAEFGDAFDPAVWGEESTKRKALDFLIEEQLLLQAVDDSRLRINDAQIAEYLKSSPTFQVDGKFSRERYSQVVNMLGFSDLGYEEQARKELSIAQLRAGIALSAFVTAAEAQRLQQLRDQKRTIGYAVVPVGDPAKIEISAADAEAYYAEHKEEFRVEEKVVLEYLQLAQEDLRDDIPIDDSFLKAYYDAHHADYTVDEERNANHILLRVREGATPEEDAAAKDKALKLRELALAGKKFEDLAMENSDDIGSKAGGGETGMFGRGAMAPEFEAAVFAMKPGDISEPVKTQFGYHLIRLKDVKPGGLKPFEDVRTAVEEAYRREQAETLYFERAEQFSDTVYEHPDSLAAAAETLNLKLATTGLLGREEIAQQFAPAVADAVWETEVLLEGLASAPLEIAGNKIVSVRVTEHVPSRVPEPADLQATITERLQRERVQRDAAQRGAALLARLQKGEDRQAVIAADKLEWREEENVERSSEQVNRAVLRAAFEAAAPAAGSTTYLGVPLGAGDYAVVGVSSVTTPPIEQIDETKTAELRRDAERTRMMIGWRDFVAALRSGAKIETYENSL